MSTRVQKGGTVFRPVAKPRARIASDVRQASVAPAHDAHAGAGLGTPRPVAASNTNAPTSSLPPSTLPPKVSPSDTVQEKGSQARPPSNTTRELDPSGKVHSLQPPHLSQKHPMPIVPRRAVLSQPIPIAVPSQPPSIPPMQAEVDHRRDDHPIPKSPAPALIEIPSSSIPPPLQASSSTHGPQHSNVPRPANVPQAINDVAQIDPALLEAVVTALQHVEQTQGSSVPPTHPHEAPAVHGDAEQSSTSPQAQPQSRPQRKRTKKTDTQDATEGNDETEGSSPSTSSKKKRASRKRVRSGTPEASQCEDNVDTPGTPSQRKRKKSGTPRKRKSRPPSPPPFDPNADPGDDIDPTAVTMGALCDDPGRGRVSSKAAQILGNHATWRAANREKRARMRAIMEAKKYGRDLEEEEENATKKVNGSPTTPSTNSDPTTSGGTSERPQDTTEPEVEEPDDANNKVHGFDYSQDIATSRYNVQVRIGPNGETIIDEDSLFVDRNQEEDTAAYTHIEESDTSKFVNSSTYSKKLRGSRWSAEETELFYDALSQFGENYELISYILPGRDRKACKNKFKAEDKKNSALITYCLTHRRPYDIQTLSRMTGKDFSGPTPVIRTPTPIQPPEEGLSVSEPQINGTSKRPRARKHSQTPALDGEEILGNISDIEKEDE